MSKFMHVSSDGLSLSFKTEEDDQSYCSDVFNLKMKHYHKQRLKYGIWASNQNKYVNNFDDLNEWDNKTMESAYQKWRSENNSDEEFEIFWEKVLLDLFSNLGHEDGCKHKDCGAPINECLCRCYERGIARSAVKVMKNETNN